MISKFVGYSQNVIRYKITFKLNSVQKKFIAITLREEESSQINDLSFHLKKLEKEQIKPK